MHGLNFILANRSQLVVLRVLYFADEPLTGRAVERASGLSNRATMMALSTLVEARAVYCDVRPNAHLYTLNHDHYLIDKALRPAFEAEDLFWDDLQKTVRRIVRPRPVAAVATGPLARDETEYGGRLMLSLLFEDGHQRIKALNSIKRLSETIRDRYALVLEHYLVDVNSMDREEHVPLWNRVEREGILLFGSLP